MGRDGQTLEQAWDGLPEARRGLNVPHFPNMFLMCGPNIFGGPGPAVYMLESWARHITAAARALDARRASTIEVRSEANESFIAELPRRQQATVWAAL